MAEEKKELRFGLSGQGSRNKYGTGGSGRVTLEKEIAKNLELQAYLEGQAFKPKEGDMQKKVTGAGLQLTKRFKKGGPVSKFIQSAIKKPGALRKSLGVKKGEKIPAGKLAVAAKKPGKMGQRARLAQTLKGLKK